MQIPLQCQNHYFRVRKIILCFLVYEESRNAKLVLGPGPIWDFSNNLGFQTILHGRTVPVLSQHSLVCPEPGSSGQFREPCEEQFFQFQGNIFLTKDNTLILLKLASGLVSSWKHEYSFCHYHCQTEDANQGKSCNFPCRRC